MAFTARIWSSTRYKATTDELNRMGQGIADAHALAAAGGGSPWLRVPAAAGNGTTDDSAAINAVLASAPPGSTVALEPGKKYALGSPLLVPPHVTVRVAHGNRTDTAQVYSVLSPLAGFSGAAVIQLLDMEAGGYSMEHLGARLTLLTIDGASAPAGLHGIQAVGRVRGVVFDRVCVQNIPGRGWDTQPYTRTDANTYRPYSWSLRDCAAVETGSDGFWFHSTTDMQLVSCESLGAGGSGFVLTACANTRMVGCQAEWSDQQGIYVTGSWLTGQGSGGLVISACTTDRNSQNGILVDATGSGQITISAPQFRRDGRNGFPGSGGGGFAGLKVVNATMPVVVNGITVYPGVGDDGAGVNSPQYAVSATGSTAVVVEAGYLHAATQAWHDGGGNGILYRGPGVVGATGSTGSPTRETVTHLDVAGRALGMATPRDHGLVAWAYDPANVVGGQPTTNGTIYLMSVYVARPITVSSILWYVHTPVGATPTAGQNEVGLYNSTGARLASANVDSAITTQGLKTTPVTPQTLSPGRYWVGFVFNAATPPSLGRGGDINATLVNAGQAASAYRAATNGTGTVLPVSVTPGSNVAYTRALWCALS